MDLWDIIILAIFIAIAVTVLKITLPIIIILVILYLAIYYLRHEFIIPENFSETNVFVNGTGGLGGFPYYYPTLNFPYNYPYYLYPWNYNYYYYPAGAYSIYTDQMAPVEEVTTVMY